MQIYKIVVGLLIVGLCIVGSVYAADPKAKRVRITDAGDYYTGIEVETALQEVGAGTTLDTRYLKLDQTTPQDISSGQPDFLAGLRAGSTNQLDIDASGNVTTTGALTVDTPTLVVNAAGYTDKVGIGTATPATTLDVNGVITCGGASAGQSIIASGLVVNEDGGATAADDFRVETDTQVNAFVVDASGNDIEIAVPAVSTSTFTSTNFISSVAIGTQPYACTSTTVNTNLNADLWDGYQFASYLDQALLTSSTPQFARAGLGAAAHATNLLQFSADGTVGTTGGLTIDLASADAEDLTITNSGAGLAHLYFNELSTIKWFTGTNTVTLQATGGPSPATISLPAFTGTIPLETTTNTWTSPNTFTGVPTGAGVGAGSVYINPASSTADYTLLGLAVGGTSKFKFDADGDLEVAGNVGIGMANPLGKLQINGGMLIQDVVTITADDTTPDVSGGNIFVTRANTVPTEITDLDLPQAGQIVTIVGGSNTNSSTITDGGNFKLSATWTASVYDTLTLFVYADNTYIELSRSDN